MASKFYYDLFHADLIAGGDFVKDRFPQIFTDKLQDCKEEEVIRAIKK